MTVKDSKEKAGAGRLEVTPSEWAGREKTERGQQGGRSCTKTQARVTSSLRRCFHHVPTPPKAPTQCSEESLPRTENRVAERGRRLPAPSPGASGRRAVCPRPLHQVGACDSSRGWKCVRSKPRQGRGRLCFCTVSSLLGVWRTEDVTLEALSWRWRDQDPGNRESPKFTQEQSSQWIGNSNLQLQVGERYNFTFFSPCPFFYFKAWCFPNQHMCREKVSVSITWNNAVSFCMEFDRTIAF